MKLYNLDHSPYATRVRIQVYHGDLPVDIAPPPAPLRTPEFSALFPLAKLPVLELDDGRHIEDSMAIMEYLEDAGLASGLRPDEAFARAQMRTVARYADTSLAQGGLSPLFASVLGGGGDTGTLVANLRNELTRGERLFASLPEPSSRDPHLGDAALVPHVGYIYLLAPMFELGDPLAGHPALASWWRWVQEQPAAARALGEMNAAFAAFAAKLGG